MNIFFLDEDIKKCAEYHVDKHCVKMILESAQLLCGVHWVAGGEAPYKLSHKNHPCSIWARESLSNYFLLCELGYELCKEYTYRYGKRHKSQDVIEWCMTHRPNIIDKGLTEQPKAMPEQYKTNSVVESYRNYYMGEKSGFAVWKNRDTPNWWI